MTHHVGLDERKTCDKCSKPFRCPTAQADRFTCGPCKVPDHFHTASEPVGKP